MDRKELFKRLAWLISLIFILNILASKFYWYTTIWWFDMPMHFGGGVWLGFVFAYFFPLKHKPLKEVFTILLLILLVGVGWEVFEIAVNEVITKNPFNLLDTASDLFFDLSGGIYAILYTRVPLENQRTNNKE